MDETLVPPGEWQQARREHDQKVLELGRERLAALRRLRGQAT
jgi:hypothetical protein